jgi:PKD repeat protein
MKNVSKVSLRSMFATFRGTPMYFTNLWRVLFIACLSFFISACKPIAQFSVSPDPVVVGQVATFDASSSIISDDEAQEEEKDKKDKKDKKEHKDKKHEKEKHKPKKTVIYNWNFGDGSSASGITVTHTFNAVGSYTVTLTVKDREGEVGVISKVVIVKPVAGALAQLDVMVRGADGVLIKGALVTLGGVSSSTNDQGQVSINSTSGTKTVVVTKAGYITQAMSTGLVDGKTSNAHLIMLPVKEIKIIGNIERAQLITASTLNASVLLPANALVDASGKTVTGTVTLELTPWDVSGSDLNAMLGNGNARSADGTTGNLISAGMMTVDFFKVSATGVREHLQLDSARTKTAVIQMDIPFPYDPNTGLISINGTTLDPYATTPTIIPMWTFNEAQGIWVEEGVGTVVPGNNPLSYMAVKATVKHFSTWNWDYNKTNGGVVDVRCEDSVGPVACNVLAEVTLPDGSKFSRSGYADAATGAHNINMPNPATYVWTGIAADGRVGTTVSGPFGNVTILLSPPKTSNFVQCIVAGAPAACNVQLSAVLTDGSPTSRSFYLSADGGSIRTAIDTTDTLAWQASTPRIQEGNELVHYEGTVTSGLNGTVTIVLANRIVELSKTLFVTCDPVAYVYEYVYDPITATESQITRTVVIDSCNINLYAYDSSNSNSYFFNSVSVPAGTVVPVVVPAIDPNGTVNLSAYGTSNTLVNYPSFSGYAQFVNSNLSNNQSITLQLTDNCDGDCGPGV